MAYKITSECDSCNTCAPLCPTGAIEEHDDKYWINPALCNNCEGYADEPQCLAHCPTRVPVPFEAQKGRTKLVDVRPATSYDLFANGKNQPFASAIVIWDVCNFLAQRQSFLWQEADATTPCYERSVNQGRGVVRLHLPDRRSNTIVNPQYTAIDKTLDMRSACMHLIYAAYAATLDRPWEQEFVISDRQIEEYLGLEKRKDLNKITKLNLIKNIAQQPCLINTSIEWAKKGRIPGLSLENSPLWHLVKIHHHFQEDGLGCKHLVGLTFTVRAGMWSKYFLNKQGNSEGTAFYQYGSLPKSLLYKVMSIWQQHEGAARMMLWLLFKSRMGKEQRITVPTLLRIAYGEERLTNAGIYRDDRKRLIRSFENDLLVLNEYGLKPSFDPVTYPESIQPLWFKLADLPDDADEAIDFWIQDGSNATRLTDFAPRGKWNMLMNARISHFELPTDWEQPRKPTEKKKRRIAHSQQAEMSRSLSGDQIAVARKTQGWSQRELAQRAGKSQSWIRDIENGRFRTKVEDQMLLRNVLGLD